MGALTRDRHGPAAGGGTVVTNRPRTTACGACCRPYGTRCLSPLRGAAPVPPVVSVTVRGCALAPAARVVPAAGVALRAPLGAAGLTGPARAPSPCGSPLILGPALRPPAARVVACGRRRTAGSVGAAGLSCLTPGPLHTAGRRFFAGPTCGAAPTSPAVPVPPAAPPHLRPPAHPPAPSHPLAPSQPPSPSGMDSCVRPGQRCSWRASLWGGGVRLRACSQFMRDRRRGGRTCAVVGLSWPGPGPSRRPCSPSS